MYQNVPNVPNVPKISLNIEKNILKYTINQTTQLYK
jgi:hypothetical protein